MIIQRKERTEKLKADRVAFIPLPAGVTQNVPEAASAMNIYGENLRGTPFLIPRIMDHILEDDGLYEHLMNRIPNYEASLSFCNNEPEEAVCRYFLVCVGQFWTGTKSHQT